MILTNRCLPGSLSYAGYWPTYGPMYIQNDRYLANSIFLCDEVSQLARGLYVTWYIDSRARSEQLHHFDPYAVIHSGLMRQYVNEYIVLTVGIGKRVSVTFHHMYPSPRSPVGGTTSLVKVLGSNLIWNSPNICQQTFSLNMIMGRCMWLIEC